MTKDQMFTRRHVLTGAAALLGATATAGTAALLVGDGGTGGAAPADA
ncbi:hypothetical protein PV413_36760 [Streptomyces scabiei]|nr:hypothetical protein [Streptomyces scabiei]MDX3152966.1 hypothetical protein [Streptomyces scabiei]